MECSRSQGKPFTARSISPDSPSHNIFKVYHAVLQSFSFPNTKGSDLHQSFYNSEGRREYGHNGSFGPKLRVHIETRQSFQIQRTSTLLLNHCLSFPCLSCYVWPVICCHMVTLLLSLVLAAVTITSLLPRLQGVLGPAACSPHSPLSGFLSHCLGKVAAGKFGNCCNGFVSHFYMF